MRLRSAIVASKAIMSREDNSLSLIGIIEGMIFAGIPEDTPPDTTVVHSMYFAVMYDDPTEEERDALIPVEFWIDTPLGPKARRDVAMGFEGSSRSRLLIGVEGIPYAGPGVYTFTAKVSDKLAIWPIEVGFDDGSYRPSSEAVPLQPLL